MKGIQKNDHRDKKKKATVVVADDINVEGGQDRNNHGQEEISAAEAKGDNINIGQQQQLLHDDDEKGVTETKTASSPTKNGTPLRKVPEAASTSPLKSTSTRNPMVSRNFGDEGSAAEPCPWATIPRDDASEQQPLSCSMGSNSSILIVGANKNMMPYHKTSTTVNPTRTARTVASILPYTADDSISPTSANSVVEAVTELTQRSPPALPRGGTKDSSITVASPSASATTRLNNKTVCRHPLTRHTTTTTTTTDGWVNSEEELLASTPTPAPRQVPPSTQPGSFAVQPTTGPPHAPSMNDVLLNDLMSELEPLPTPPISQPTSQPGSFAFHGTTPVLYRRSSSSVDVISSESSTNTTTPAVASQQQQQQEVPLQQETLVTHLGLAVANLVEEEDEILTPTDLPEAQDFDLEAASKRTQKTQQLKRIILFGIVCGVVVLIVSLTLLVQLVGMEDSPPQPITHVHDPSSSSSSSPTQAPTSLDDRVLSLLPDYTVVTILEDPDSAQYKAYEWLMADSSPYLSSDKRILQRYALATFFFGMGGKNWVTKDGWLDHNLHECQWHATKQFPPYVNASDQDPDPCEHYWPMTANTSSSATLEDQEVAREYEYHNLRLKSMDLMGTIPPQINLLSSLRSIDLAHNKVTGNLPTEIGLLSQLTSLVLPGNSITGSLPSEMGLLRDLEIHDLHLNLLSGSLPSEVTQMTKLSVLSVMHNEVSGTIPTSIGRLSFLKLLDVSRNQGIEGRIPTQIGLLKDLVYLDLSQLPLLSGRIPSEIGPLATAGSLFKANFNGTKHLSGTVPDGLCFLTTSECVRTGPFPALPKAQCQLDLACSDLLCGCNCPCGG